MQQNNTTKIKFDNKSTQNSLEKAKIPFIFYSKELRQFLTADNKIIDNISQLRLKEAKIIDKPLEEEQISNKTAKLRNLEDFLNKKRLLGKEGLTEDDYYERRKEVFPKDEPINLPDQVIIKIKDCFKNKIFFSSKIIKSMRYAYVSPLYMVKPITIESDLFGLIFYKKEIFIYYDGIIHILSEEDEKNVLIIKELEDFIQKDLDNKSDIKDEYGLSYNKEKNYENLLKYNLNKPSSIYVYQIKCI